MLRKGSAERYIHTIRNDPRLGLWGGVKGTLKGGEKEGKKKKRGKIADSD